jgi:hypothetical protein
LADSIRSTGTISGLYLFLSGYLVLALSCDYDAVM